MPRKSSIPIWLNSQSGASLQSQLVTQIRQMIHDGTLPADGAMPSTRELANQLKVSRNTVVYAYDRLTAEGYLESRLRSGIFVSRSIDVMSPRKPRRIQHQTWGSEMLILPTPFRPCQPDVNLFPMLIWNRIRMRAIRAEPSRLLHYQSGCNLGLPALRKALAEYLRAQRGVQCDWRQIAITSGSQEALFILSKLLLSDQARVYMEDPGYPGAQLAWQNAGAAIVSGTLDDQGVKDSTSEGTTLFSDLHDPFAAISDRRAVIACSTS